MLATIITELVKEPSLEGRVHVALPINPSLSVVQKPPIHIAWLRMCFSAQLHIYIMATSGQNVMQLHFPHIRFYRCWRNPNTIW